MTGLVMIDLAAANARRLAILARQPDPLAGYSTATQQRALDRINADIDRLAQEEHEASVRQHQEPERWDGLS